MSSFKSVKSANTLDSAFKPLEDDKAKVDQVVELISTVKEDILRGIDLIEPIKGRRNDPKEFLD